MRNIGHKIQGFTTLVRRLPTLSMVERWIAHAKELTYAEPTPVYGDWIDWQPNAWWWEEQN